MLKSLALLLLLLPCLPLRADDSALSPSPTAQVVPADSDQALPADEEPPPPRRRRRVRRKRVRPANYVRPVGLKVFGSPLGQASPDMSSELGLEIEIRRGVALSIAPQYFSITTPLQAKVYEYHYDPSTYTTTDSRSYREGDPLRLSALGVEVRYRFSRPEERSGFFVGSLLGLGFVNLPVKSRSLSASGQPNRPDNVYLENDSYLLGAAELGYQQRLFGWLALSGGVRLLWGAGIPQLDIFSDYSPPPPDDFQRVTGFVQVGIFAL